MIQPLYGQNNLYLRSVTGQIARCHIKGAGRLMSNIFSVTIILIYIFININNKGKQTTNEIPDYASQCHAKLGVSI